MTYLLAGALCFLVVFPASAGGAARSATRAAATLWSCVAVAAVMATVPLLYAGLLHTGLLEYVGRQR